MDFRRLDSYSSFGYLWRLGRCSNRWGSHACGTLCVPTRGEVTPVAIFRPSFNGYVRLERVYLRNVLDKTDEDCSVLTPGHQFWIRLADAGPRRTDLLNLVQHWGWGVIDGDNAPGR